MKLLLCLTFIALVIPTLSHACADHEQPAGGQSKGGLISSPMTLAQSTPKNSSGGGGRQVTGKRAAASSVMSSAAEFFGSMDGGSNEEDGGYRPIRTNIR